MIYYGSNMKIKVDSRCDYADDMQILKEFQELSKKICEKYDVKIEISQEQYTVKTTEEEAQDCFFFERYEGKENGE